MSVAAIIKNIIAPLYQPKQLLLALWSSRNWLIPALLIALIIPAFSGYSKITHIVGLMLCLCLALQHRISFWLVSALCLIGSCYIPIGYDFGKFRFGHAVSMMNTDSSETWEFICGISPEAWLLTAVAILAILAYIKNGKRFAPKANVFCLVLVIALLMAIPPGKLLAGIGENIINSYRDMALLQKQNAIPDNFVVTDVKLNYQNIVVVVGESVVRDYLSVYGYKHPTTPWLNEAPGHFYSNYVAAAGSTVLSLTRTLAISDGLNYELHNNVVALANKAGFETWWISNQGFMDTYDTPVSRIGIRAAHSYFPVKGASRTNRHDDMEMLDHIENALDSAGSSPKVIFAHMYGSHTNACERLFDFPMRFHIREQQEINCYLATIEKLDTFIRKTVDLLKKKNEPWALIYFSDHGVKVDESSRPIRHNSKDRDKKQNYNVPFFILTSNDKQHMVDDTPLSALSFLSLFEWLAGFNSEQVKAKSPHEASANNIKVFMDGKLVPYAELKDKPLVN